ncbi:MAG: cob(I)yrinic acid a,c-diamide adenosyltransferase [Bacteroides sp.]|nr:cob(I)yrinic acid a,c-diamide adenosyltransferase [Eubacterium sp.]MCM1417844.1 cob(I)yrinic acid a,c-diamide adenosyltransferase [Roseburia sp.]MCM1461283.1 cob(I)yrinic acid a,c-diamide adenosyltransferase [Bacteroides sp.]
MGLLHIYCGDGKGKTTAAIGLAIRAAGAGMSVRFVQLLKGGATSELEALALIPKITVTRCDREYGFVKNMSGAEKRSITECHDRLIADAFTAKADMVILDEFNAAYGYGLLDRAAAERLIFEGVKKAEVVLTGRDPAEAFTSAADYLSEIKCVKHPYEKGIAARRGIEL